MFRTILIGALLWCGINAKAQVLERQLIDFRDNDDYSTFGMLDSLTDGYKVFMQGENHTYVQSNFDMQLKMFKYLYRQEGVRHMIIEWGYGRGRIVDDYIQTGDSDLLEILILYTSDEYISFFKSLHEFNKELPDDAKIQVHGIDLERDYGIGFKVIEQLLPVSEPPEDIRLSVETLRSLAAYSDAEHEIWSDPYSYYYDLAEYVDYNKSATVTELLQDYADHEALFEMYLGDSFEAFKKIMEGLGTYQEWQGYVRKDMMQAEPYRERFLYQNFLEVFEAHPNDKFFMQFGRSHTAKEELNGEWSGFFAHNSLAARIDHSEDDRLAGTVFSIGVFYPRVEDYRFGEELYPHQDQIFSDARNDTITMEYVQNTEYYEGLYGKFNLILINKKPVEFVSVGQGYDYYIKRPSNVFVHLDVGYGFLFTKLAALNNSNLFANVDELDSPIWSYSGALSVIDKATGLSSSFRYDYFVPQERTESDTFGVELSGFTMRMNYGYDVSPTDWAHLVFYTGWGYGRYRLKVNEENTVIPQSGFFDLTEKTYFNNPVILWNFSLDGRINLKLFSIGVKTGYQFDLSRKRWRQDGVYDGNTPKTSMSGFWAQANLSLFFH